MPTVGKASLSPVPKKQAMSKHSALSTIDIWNREYCSVPSKCPWALGIHGQKKGEGHLHGEAICIYTRTVGLQKWGWALTWDTMVMAG